MSVPFIAYARRDKLSITGCRRGRKRRSTIRRTDNKGKTDRRGDGRKQGCAEIRQRISRSGEREERGWGGATTGPLLDHRALSTRSRREATGSWLEYENNISFLPLGMIDIYSTPFGPRSSLCRARFEDSAGIVPRFLPRKTIQRRRRCGVSPIPGHHGRESAISELLNIERNRGFEYCVNLS